MAKTYTQIIISLLIISSVISGMYGITLDLASEDKYNVSTSKKYSSKFNSTQRIADNINNTISKVRNIKANPGALLSLPVAIFGVFKSILMAPFNLMWNFLTALTTALPMPGWAKALTFSIIGMVLIAALVALALRYSKV